MIKVAFFDTKPYDRENFAKSEYAKGIEWLFIDERLSFDTADKVKDAKIVCPFVNCTVDRSCLKRLKELGVEYVALRSSGYNHVDLEAAKELQIRVTHVPEYSPFAVAEHAVALLLSLNRKTHIAYSRIAEHNFALDGLLGFDLFQKTAGIVGAGNIGKVAAQIFRGFGMEVLVSDPKQDEKWADAHGIKYVDFKTLLEKSSIISLHVPLDNKTRHMINEESISLMKPGTYLINTSRGAIIDTKALLKALDEKKIAGAGLDVYEREAGIFFEDYRGKDLKDPELDQLINHPHVLITSHQGFFTKEALHQISYVSIANIKAFCENRAFLEGTVLT